MVTIKILHLEDNSLDSELILSEIEQQGMKVEYLRVERESELISALNANAPDIILADYQLPEYNGIEALRICASSFPGIPFIFISGTLGEEKAVEMLKYGASDYILKQNLTRLVPAITFALNQKKLELEKKKAEFELIQSEKKYRNIFESIQDVFCRTDLNGKVQVISPSIKRMTGYEPSEMINNSILLLYEFSDDFARMVESLKKHHEVWDFETISVSKEGKLKYISINAHLIYDENSAPIGVESIMRDVNARKKAEGELIKAKEKAEESDRLKMAFLANISHEIRTPMNGILGFAELLKDAVTNRNDTDSYLEMIESSGKRMLNLINQIIDMSIIESGKLEINTSKINLNILLSEMRTFFKQKAKQKKLKLLIGTSCEDNYSYMYTDSQKLESIFLSLIDNAIKYTNNGIVEFGYKKDGVFFEFYVKDTGIGIPDDKLTHIFDSFYQVDQRLCREHEGAGLGLSICHAYIKKMGGQVWVKSIEREGSVFYFRLPSSDERRTNNHNYSNSQNNKLYNTEIG